MLKYLSLGLLVLVIASCSVANSKDSEVSSLRSSIYKVQMDVDTVCYVLNSSSNPSLSCIKEK